MTRRLVKIGFGLLLLVMLSVFVPFGGLPGFRPLQWIEQDIEATAERFLESAGYLDLEVEVAGRRITVAGRVDASLDALALLPLVQQIPGGGAVRIGELAQGPFVPATPLRLKKEGDIWRLSGDVPLIQAEGLLFALERLIGEGALASELRAVALPGDSDYQQVLIDAAEGVRQLGIPEAELTVNGSEIGILLTTSNPADRDLVGESIGPSFADRQRSLRLDWRAPLEADSLHLIKDLDGRWLVDGFVPHPEAYETLLAGLLETIEDGSQLEASLAYRTTPSADLLAYVAGVFAETLAELPEGYLHLNGGRIGGELASADPASADALARTLADNMPHQLGYAVDINWRVPLAEAYELRLVRDGNRIEIRSHAPSPEAAQSWLASVPAVLSLDAQWRYARNLPPEVWQPWLDLMLEAALLLEEGGTIRLDARGTVEVLGDDIAVAQAEAFLQELLPRHLP